MSFKFSLSAAPQAQGLDIGDKTTRQHVSDYIATKLDS